LSYLPYTPVYKIEIIQCNDKINSFIAKWKSCNKRASIIIKDFNTYELGMITSFKKNEPYTLYRGISKVYKSEKYLSSWSTDITIAKRFGKYIYTITIDPMYVFMDLTLIHDSEKEVIVFPSKDIKIKLFVEVPKFPELPEVPKKDTCGSFGGITKKRLPCKNTSKNGLKCYLHNK